MSGGETKVETVVELLKGLDKLHELQQARKDFDGTIITINELQNHIEKLLLPRG